MKKIKRKRTEIIHLTYFITILCIDLRFENFGEGNELFAISAFYKVFKDPIELSYYEQARETFQPRNLGEAKVYGLEIEFRKNLNNFFKLEGNSLSYIEMKFIIIISSFHWRVKERM